MTARLCILLSIFSVLESSVLTAQAAAPAQRPNIVLILSDDQAWTDYGFMGHPDIQTPHPDSRAARSWCLIAGTSLRRCVDLLWLP